MSDAATPSDAATGDDELGNDIRLLGRLLGDVVREQAGDEVFELAESVRRCAIDARRRSSSPIRDLEALLTSRPIEQQLHVIRAFDWLSLLANTAEDVHVERRSRHHRIVGSAPQPGSLAATFEEVAAGEIGADAVVETLRDLEVSPVITAHPTEVRRKTILAVLHTVADLLEERSRLPPNDPRRNEIEALLQTKILTLWQTAILRLSKLRVTDEINEALRYYESSLFATVPRLTADLAQTASDRFGVEIDTTETIRMGSWIGGDRDGNPFVTADVMRHAVQRQAETALGNHLAAIRRLSVDLSISSRLVTPTARLQQLADESGDDSPFRADEPYRRALRGMYSRLYSFADGVLLEGTAALDNPAPRVPRPAYA